MSEERTYDDGYDDGYRDGKEEGYSEGYDDAHETVDIECEIADREGYDRGYEAGAADAPTLTVFLDSASFNPLEDFVGRWDAAERVWVLCQDGREVRIQGEH